MFDIKTIRENPDAFKEMIDVLLKEDFPPMEEYRALIKYRAELHGKYDDEPENIFDYL